MGFPPTLRIQFRGIPKTQFESPAPILGIQFRGIPQTLFESPPPTLGTITYFRYKLIENRPRLVFKEVLLFSINYGIAFKAFLFSYPHGLPQGTLMGKASRDMKLFSYPEGLVQRTLKGKASRDLKLSS